MKAATLPKSDAHRAKIRAAHLRRAEERRRLHPLKERLLAKLDRSGGPNACWVWTGHRDNRGYGVYKTRGKARKAHRLVYEALVGPIDDDLALLHNCHPLPDNPACCNPKHLRPGTHEENSIEAGMKGQMLKGERHGGSKLTEEQVSLLFELRRAGVGSKDLAIEFGVTQTTVNRILAGAAWAHRADRPTERSGRDNYHPVKEIRFWASQGVSAEVLGARYKLPPTIVRQICGSDPPTTS